MTKQEAIEVIKDFVAYEKHVNAFVYKGSTSIPIEALNMAIEALEQIESGRYVKGECSICSKEYGTLGCCTTVNNHWVYSCKEGMGQYAEALVHNPKYGYWIHGKEVLREYIGDTCVAIKYEDWHCSSCKMKVEEPYKPNWNYCPCCGAKMVEKEFG